LLLVVALAHSVIMQWVVVVALVACFLVLV
jgi:hypothetical protein